MDLYLEACEDFLFRGIISRCARRYQFGMESRYCYRASNETSLRAKQAAKDVCETAGAAALRHFRSKQRPPS